MVRFFYKQAVIIKKYNYSNIFFSKFVYSNFRGTRGRGALLAAVPSGNGGTRSQSLCARVHPGWDRLGIRRSRRCRLRVIDRVRLPGRGSRFVFTLTLFPDETACGTGRMAA